MPEKGSITCGLEGGRVVLRRRVKPSPPKRGADTALSFKGATETRCQRCGDRCQASPANPSSDARPFRRAAKGNCAACAVCLFFQGDVDHGIGHALPPNFDPEGLKLPHMQAQFARVLAVGRSDLGMDEINWDAVIRKWNIHAGAHA